MRKPGRLNAACTAGVLVAATACSPHARSTTGEAANPRPEIMSFATYQEVEHEEPYVYDVSAWGRPGAVLRWRVRRFCSAGVDQIQYVALFRSNVQW